MSPARRFRMWKGVYLSGLLRQFVLVSTATYSEEVRSRFASRLLDKARQLGLQLPIDLERLAIARGCNYYERDLNARTPPLAKSGFPMANLPSHSSLLHFCPPHGKFGWPLLCSAPPMCRLMRW